MTEGQFMHVSAIHADGNSLLKLSFETNDSFNVSCSREQINRRYRAKRVAKIKEDTRVAREGVGVTGDIEDLIDF